MKDFKKNNLSMKFLNSEAELILMKNPAIFIMKLPQKESDEQARKLILKETQQKVKYSKKIEDTSIIRDFII